MIQIKWWMGLLILAAVILVDICAYMKGWNNGSNECTDVYSMKLQDLKNENRDLRQMVIQLIDENKQKESEQVILTESAEGLKDALATVEGEFNVVKKREHRRERSKRKHVKRHY